MSCDLCASMQGSIPARPGRPANRPRPAHARSAEFRSAVSQLISRLGRRRNEAAKSLSGLIQVNRAPHPSPLPIRWGEGRYFLRTATQCRMAGGPCHATVFSLAPSDGERVRVRGSVATWKNCILHAADKLSAPECFDGLPIANRRYSRVQLCATRTRNIRANPRIQWAEGKHGGSGGCVNQHAIPACDGSK
jgi:hypothetical protein